MRLGLTPHPDFPADAITALEVEIARAGPERLELVYRVRGDIAGLLVPATADAERTDGLWASTCFELFAKPAGGEAYCEFNFAPSSQWAAYAFDEYRAGMRELALETPAIDMLATDDAFELRVAVEASALRAGAHMAVTAVVEEASGARSYWSVRHAPGKPDFHHAESFAIEAPANEVGE
ncbi:DOMON-like domain-containing protein [Vitreimonas flagellata]|uniref:DOMON-like domain-containing protein n=1 Tax=Vitreimonas flagellata TaxID=2560861 RepID=UPI001074ED7B|nr:DOMON-like domain-containing protein [Vitreimonas flagellata]